MKRVLFDTDVCLDVLLQRQPYFSTSAFALDTVGQGKIEGFVAGHAVTNLFYLLRRQLGSQKKSRNFDCTHDEDTSGSVQHKSTAPNSLSKSVQVRVKNVTAVSTLGLCKVFKKFYKLIYRLY